MFPCAWMKSNTGCGDECYDDVGEWLFRAHQFAPAVPRNIDGVMNTDTSGQRILNHTDINMRGIQ